MDIITETQTPTETLYKHLLMTHEQGDEEHCQLIMYSLQFIISVMVLARIIGGSMR